MSSFSMASNQTPLSEWSMPVWMPSKRAAAIRSSLSAVVVRWTWQRWYQCWPRETGPTRDLRCGYGQRWPSATVSCTDDRGDRVRGHSGSDYYHGGDDKSRCQFAHFAPDVAILDASLTLGLPASISAMTGIDAMVHAIEAYTSKIKRTPFQTCWPCVH